MIIVYLIAGLLLPQSNTLGYGNSVAMLPVNTIKRLAEASAPNKSGAIGRNKQAYIHVRFQRGMHNIADYGLVTKQPDIVDRFLTAAEYSIKNQLPSGDFKLVIPESLKSQGKPSMADRVSGVAFFVSSLGLGMYALETNDWFNDSDECVEQRKRLTKLKPRLQATLNYLLKHKQYLELADKHAPNRLLFDALAFQTLGKILNQEKAIKVGSSFVSKAIEQVNQQDGYFIEAGGFDSSYNAVASALTFRLLMLHHQEYNLKMIGLHAIQWQKTRVSNSGEVLTEGNTRVRPGKSGEHFLGKEKDVDIGHVVEALALASHVLAEDAYNKLALKVIGYYKKQYQRSK